MKRLLIFFITAFVFFLTTPHAHAALPSDLCQSVKLMPLVNNTTPLEPAVMTNDLGTNPVIYFDAVADDSAWRGLNGYFYQTGTSFHPIDLKKNIVMGIDIDTTALATNFSGNRIPDDLEVTYEGGWVGAGRCSYAVATASQLQAGPRFTSNAFFTTSTIVGDITEACKKKVLTNSSGTGVRIMRSGDEVWCPDLSFQQGKKGPAPCSLTFDKPGGYTNTEQITMSASPVDAPYSNLKCSFVISCSGNVKLADGTTKTCSGKLARLNETDCSTVTSSSVVLDPLDKNTYTAEYNVYYSDPIGGAHVITKKAVLCSASVTVVKPGETPIPIATNAPGLGLQTVGITIAEGLDMCDSIPAGTMCGTESCQRKCIDCTINVKGGIWTALGCLPTKIQDLVSQLFTLFSGLLAGFIFICIMWNGMKVMLSRGSPDAFKKAQEAITSCIIGLLVLLFSVLFLKVVGVDILKIPGMQ
ncbi:MAG: pilin [Patescibacteria group bacterium]|jgi:hypothetical protein